MVENTVGKGEIARYEQFLLFSRCFLKDPYLKPGLPGDRNNEFAHSQKKFFAMLRCLSIRITGPKG